MWLLGTAKGAARGDLQRRLEQGVTHQDVVGFAVSVTQLDYAELKTIDSLRVPFEASVRDLLAGMAGNGVQADHVAMMCSVDVSDVLTVQCVVTPPPGVQASEVLSAIKAKVAAKSGGPSLADSLAKRFSEIKGIQSVSSGNIQVLEANAPAQMPIIYPDLKLDKKHGIPNGVFSLFEHLHALDDTRIFNAANADELVAEEVVWAMKKVSEVSKDTRLERLFVWMVTNLQKKDRRSCNVWASTVAPNTLQFILAENPVKEEICGRSAGFPREKLLAYATDSLVSVAIAIVAADVLGHWTYDFGPNDQSFLGEAAEKLSSWPDASVARAQGLWDRVACRYIVVEHAVASGSPDNASAYLQRTPKDILCSRFKAPWRGPDADASFFHLFPAFLSRGDKDSADNLIDCLAQADVYSASDLGDALRVFMEDPEVPMASKKHLLVTFVTACRRLEAAPMPSENTSSPGRKCSIFKNKAAKEEPVCNSPRSTKDLELIALDTLLKEFRARRPTASKATSDSTSKPPDDSDLAEMLEAVLLLASGDGLWLWAKRKVSEDAQMATDAKTLLKTVGLQHVAKLMREAVSGDKKFKYEDERARELIDGTKLWTAEPALRSVSPTKKKQQQGPDAVYLGQVLRMYFKLDLALEGGSILNFARALDEGVPMGSTMTMLAPPGSALRLAICSDVRKSLGPRCTMKEVELDPLLCNAGLFEPTFQGFLKGPQLEEARSHCGPAGGTSAKDQGGNRLVRLLEAITKIISLKREAKDLPPQDVIMDVCEQCAPNPVTWQLLGRLMTAMRNWQYTRDSNAFDLKGFSECAGEISKTGKLLQYKLQGGVSPSLLTDVERVIDNFLNKNPPRSWISSIRSLDTVIFLLEYMGKEDLKLAYERFDLECRKNNTDDVVQELLKTVKSFYSQPLASSTEVDIGEAIKKKASMVSKPVQWRGASFGTAEWKMVLEIAQAAAESMKQRYSVIMLPHHTQMISLLMFAIRTCAAGSGGSGAQDLPRTMLARVGTGEGKSLIIGMLAAFVAKRGLRAHVVNNNRVLTQRDYRGNAGMFEMLGIPASADPADIKNKECLIVYCTGDDVESACLDSLMQGSSDEYERGVEDAVLIVDEVDGLIFDRGTTSSKWFGDREFSDWVNEWLSQLQMYGKIQKDWDDFRSGDEWTRALQKELEEAYALADTKVEGVDYTKRGDRMYLLDPKTKMIKEQEWALWLEILKSQRDHPAQWIEYKYEKAILSSLQCFMSYSCIFGLTGSLGQSAERKYLGEHYEATSFCVPYFLDTCRTEGKGVQGKKVPTEISKQPPMPSQYEQDLAVVELATKKCTEVPVLVIAKDSEAVRGLAEQLRERLAEVYPPPPVEELSAEQDGEEGEEGEEARGPPPPRDEVIELLHNPRNPKEFVELVDRATEPLTEARTSAVEEKTEKRQAWRITVTTAEGGRGHDYRVVDPSIDEQGGLLLILTFVPWSEREWIQFLGRTGRQDHAGQYAVFLSQEDELVQKAQPIKKPEEAFVDAILRHGDMETEKFLQGTKEEIVKGRLMHTFTMRYWALHKQDKTTAKQNWEWKKLCKDYPKTSTKDIQDKFYGIFPHEKKLQTRADHKPQITSLSTTKKEDLLQSTDGQRYKGDLVGGKPHGYGVFKTGDGARYEGQWHQGQRSGKGKYVDASGAMYEGQWKEHDKSGKGVESYPDKARYEGEFQAGCKHGNGKYTTSTGATYEGQFRKDKYDGEGCYDFTSGRKYIGQWKAGQMEGQGKMVWANGVSYEGSYEQDVRHGEGIVRWPDGRVYQGHWHKGRLVGSGVMLDKDGAQRMML